MFLFCLALLVGQAAGAFSAIDLATFTTGTAGSKIIGAASNSLGITGGSAGDVNGDTFDDFFVSASSGNYVIVAFSRTGGYSLDVSSFTASDTNGFRITGGGYYAGAAGDINGDGYDDVMVGDQNADPLSRTNAGTVYVIFGRSTSIADVVATSFTTSDTVGFRIHGAASFQYLGQRVGPAGDVNDDGFDDICVSSQTASISYIVFGHRNGFTDLDLDTLVNTGDSRGYRIVGGGASISTIGDYNHDGFGDVLVGAPGTAGTNGASSGVVYVIFGHSNETAFPQLSLGTFTSSTQGFMVHGAFAGDQLGSRGGYAGDFNGDGVDDFLIGAELAQANGKSSAGMTYIIFGDRYTTTFSTINLLTFTSGNKGFKIFGAVAADKLGSGVRYAGDINVDGIDDIVISAVSADPLSRTNAGAAYVIYGRRNTTAFVDIDMTTFTSGTVGFALFGAAIGDALGEYTVGYAGDVNADNIDDFYVGAQSNDALGRSNAGAAYIIHGVPYLAPTFAPSIAPTAKPTAPPTCTPTLTPTAPSAEPTVMPSNPTAEPTITPIVDPTIQPTPVPSALPTSQPSCQPSSQPTSQPSGQPSSRPSSQPSGQPTERPTTQPSGQPFSLPSAQPSTEPTAQPSTQPSGLPSSQPSSPPSSQPSSQPTVNMALLSKILSSPSYLVHNGFGFAVSSVNGSVHTWGEAATGGDSSNVRHLLTGNVTRVVGTRFSFAAQKDDGSVVPWGEANAIREHGGDPVSSYSLSSIVGNEAAYAGIVAATGEVRAFGSKDLGGDLLDGTRCRGCAQALSSGVTSIAASAGSFAAMKADGTVFAWGSPHSGADVSAEFLSLIAGATLVVATRSAFAVLLHSGGVLAWGGKYGGGDTSVVADQLASGVLHIAASKSAFVAFKTDYSIVAWGYGPYGGDTSAVTAELSANVTFVAHTFLALAALKSDGSVTTWGDANCGGDSSAVQAQLVDVASIWGNSKAFAALTSTGRVVTWGKAAYGGQIPSNKVSALSSGVVSIYHTDRAFAALKTGGTVVVWGQAGHGGSPGAAVEAHLVSGVHTICSNDVAFSVIKTDGSVVGWGHPVSIPHEGVLFNVDDLIHPAVCA